MKKFKYSLSLVLGLTLLAITLQSTLLVSCTTHRTAITVQNAYPELPTLRKGATYSARLDAVRRIAHDDESSGAIAPGSYDQTVKMLTHDDVLYQTYPTGEVIACIPMLAAKIDHKMSDKSTVRMQGIFDKAYAEGRQITSEMIEIAQANNFYLEGLENAVKAASHVEDKASRWLEWWREENDSPEASEEDVAETLYDLVRFSVLTTKENYVKTALQLIKILKERGITITKIDNRFLGRDGQQDFQKTYRAVHLMAKKGEREFEIQLHDISSQSIRDYTHEVYERMRQLDENSDEYKKLAQMCIDAWKDYQNPEGIEQVK